MREEKVNWVLVDILGRQQKGRNWNRLFSLKVVSIQIFRVDINYMLLFIVQLSEVINQVALHIREAHLFTTTDGFCLSIFHVDGWSHQVNFLNATLI